MPEEIKWLWDNMYCVDTLKDVTIILKDGTYYISNIPKSVLIDVAEFCDIAKDKYNINMEVVI